MSVLLDWATDGTVKLVQFEGWLLAPGDIEEVVGVEYVIAQELEGVPCHWFVPALVAAFTMPPELRPY